MMIIKPGVDDAELVRLISLKSRAGAEVLYDRYAMVLLLVIIRIVPGKKEAEGVLEQTYIKVWNSFDHYIQQNEKLLPWMIVSPEIWQKMLLGVNLFRAKTAVKT